MQIEKAVSKIERVNKYRSICYESLRYLEDRLQYMDDFGSGEKGELQDKFRYSLLQHHDFYEFVDVLDEWAKSESPNPKDYGVNAEAWLRAEKGTHYGLWAMLGGFGIGMAGSIAGGPIISLPFLAIGGVGGLAIQYFRYRTETLGEREDAAGFIKDLAVYYGRDKHFNKLTMQFLEDSMSRYSDSLKDLIDNFKEHGGHDEINNLADNYIEVQTFRGCAKDVILAIRKSKKNLVPSWGGGISPALITAEADLTIGHLKRNMENIRKSTSDLTRM